MNEIERQQKEAVEALNVSRTILARVRRLLREQESYSPAAYEESVNCLMSELGCARRQLTTRMSALVALHYGGVKGQRPDSE
jgi:hypothetical protein